MRRCVRNGLISGLTGGLIGGLPTLISLSREDLARSIRSIAHLVPGNSRIRSNGGRLVAGSIAHMSISLFLGVVYVCIVRRRPIRFAVFVWAINIGLLEPQRMREEDRSRTLLDHLCWSAVVHSTKAILERRS